MIKLNILFLIFCVGYISVEELTDVCLGCICQGMTGCSQSPKCEGESPCGMFLISKYYWIDGGQPTIHGQSSNESDAHQNCCKDPFCAALTVRGYMKRYAKDCNKDGAINCVDYMAMHRLGGIICNGTLDIDYFTVVKECLASAPRL